MLRPYVVLPPATASAPGADRPPRLGLLRLERLGLQGFHRRLKAGDDFPWEDLAHELLDVPHEQPLVGRQQREREPARAGPRRAAHARPVELPIVRPARAPHPPD